MLRLTLLLAALLSLSLIASAQDRIVSVAPPAPDATPAPASPAPPDFNNLYIDTRWQIAFGYQYNRLNVTGKPFNTEGFNISFVRYFTDWVGLEAVMGAGFGNTHTATNPPNLDAKTIFAAGGFRLARRHDRVEPFIHALEGLEHFRFTQSSPALGSNSAFAWEGGGGVDFHFNQHASVRAEGDYLGTRLNDAIQRHFQATAGLVMNF